MVDLAAMRDALAKQGVDPSLVNPKCPTDLIVDHSLQIDYSKWWEWGEKGKNKTVFKSWNLMITALKAFTDVYVNECLCRVTYTVIMAMMYCG